MTTQRTFLPAAGHDWFLPLYDPLTKLLGVEQARRELLVQAALQPLHRVLDIGCGTGTLSILVKTLHPAVDVTALDPDERALARARRKALRAGTAIQFDQGFSDALPYADATFDRVFSSMMFHHLNLKEKENTLLEIRRVLKPGGRLQMLDLAGPDPAGKGGVHAWFHSHLRLRDNAEGRVLAMMSDAWFVGAKKLAERRMFFGKLAASRHL